MALLGERAVVLGASMAGLVAARVLADFYDSVVVVERDVLPDMPAQRRGVPQGRHVHGLLAGGSCALNTLFPGMLDEMVAAGGHLLDDCDLSRVLMRLGGHDLNLAGPFGKPISGYLASRPFLEAHVRQRVRSLGNISLLDGHDVVELLAAKKDRVDGVRVADRGTRCDQELRADLVVDAMGRGGRTPAFLEALGYARPAEERITVEVAYASQLLRIPAGTLAEKLILVGAVPDRPTGGALFACEHQTWILTLAGLAGNEPPTDRAGMIGFAAEFAPPPMMAALQAAEPLTEVSRYRYPASVRRRYDRMLRFPAGLLVCGDSMCSFNPVYGQGMSIAALEAITLRACLSRGSDDLARRFFKASAKPLSAAWQMASGADLALPQVQGRRSIQTRLANRYTRRLLAAAESDGVVAEAFFRVMHLVDPPSRLLRPDILSRVATAERRKPAVPVVPVTEESTHA
ncbi:NAD(P)/FAD-dependent oxidoreductase [[Mycobacterium] crassicus]|uniref:2-polyprenyl-6-methoxyphenol hydroxylase-like oxidoreductase n=1 Tax=[Mycobacterium] crassicus TaxID=2872309 RepID=A0ABU5XRF8_9MYCO|nr:2-polyprenyl-6-methoxyphenol hydroxylase-like oxidoreductase [Mycolicibacter sp. MYC098]MEB3023666.1 2-polyprenyl-6-methoxyphenol hydroxylase-like oxidoreductase [Mycolicibacter sp. MYC098]